MSKESGCIAAAIKRDRRAVEKINAQVWMYNGGPHTTSSNARRLLVDYEHHPQYVQELVVRKWRGQQTEEVGIEHHLDSSLQFHFDH